MTIKKTTKKNILELVDLIIEIVKLIRNGISEKDAVKEAAHKFNISYDKANKIWKKRKKIPFIT